MPSAPVSAPFVDSIRLFRSSCAYLGRSAPIPHRGGVVVRNELLVNCWVFCLVASAAPVLSQARDVAPGIPWFPSCEGRETSLAGAQRCARALSEACLLWRLARLGRMRSSGGVVEQGHAKGWSEAPGAPGAPRLSSSSFMGDPEDKVECREAACPCMCA